MALRRSRAQPPYGRLSSRSPNRRCRYSSCAVAVSSRDSMDNAPRFVVRKHPVVSRASWLTSSCCSSARPIVPGMWSPLLCRLGSPRLYRHRVRVWSGGPRRGGGVVERGRDAGVCRGRAANGDRCEDRKRNTDTDRNKDTVVTGTGCCVQNYGGRRPSLHTGNPANNNARKHRREQTPTRIAFPHSSTSGSFIPTPCIPSLPNSPVAPRFPHSRAPAAHVIVHVIQR
jgi:hypothetical protein